MNTSAGPKVSPPDHLHVKCAQLLPRLRLIPEFKPWLDLCLESGHIRYRSKVTPHAILWHCFSLGAPLCVLLDLLGTPSSGKLYSSAYGSDHDISTSTEQEKMLRSFIDRVQLLEVQGRVPYGEIFRVEDLVGGTHPGFGKVLRTVERVLAVLQATYPGLYFLQAGSAMIRADHFEELIDSERAHVDLLATMTASANTLVKLKGLHYGADRMVIECLAIFLERLLQYHAQVLSNLDKSFSTPHSHEDWSDIFALNEEPLRATALGAQRSYCVHYLAIIKILKNDSSRVQPQSIAAIHVDTLLDHISEPLFRITDQQRLLQSILDVTTPTDASSFDSLCFLLHKTSEAADEIDGIGQQARTMKSTEVLRNRVRSWVDVNHDPDQMGLLVLDDLLLADAASGLQHSVFLFESVLLCCQESGGDGSRGDGVVRSFTPCYPVAHWEFGPAMIRNQSLDVLFAVPTSYFKSVRRVSPGAFEIDWIKGDILYTHSFTALFVGQCDQWYSALQAFVPQVHNPLYPKLLRLALDEHEEELLSEEEDFGGRRSAHPRPWSLIGRKGTRSESSSMIQQEHYEHGLPVSPNMLPSLFYGLGDRMLRSPSPGHLSVKSVFSHHQIDNGKNDQLPPTPPPDSITLPNNASAIPLDLTGQIRREGKYPCAHGGFADVWKGVWHRDSNDRKVAIKVLRSRSDDPEVEAKMQKRLRRELRVWKQLDHEHVLPLYGTASDFGHYTAFVCPWLENGTVSRYLERCGDVLSMMDRLGVLCEVAAGLSYLHSFSVVHGDLTGSNILINDEGKACLCDFGLSSIAADFQSTSCLTSTLGGNVRWAAPELYSINEDDSVPTVNTYSDIYSFGSVMLEILSGHVPYSYLLRDAQVVIEVHKGVKPRRPSTPFVTNQLWSFINLCWTDEPSKRPDVTEVSRSLQDFLHRNRRHTG